MATDPDLEHVLDCSAQKTAHAAFDRPLSDQQLAGRQVGTELAQQAEERRQRREGALERVRQAASRDPLWRDLMTILGEG